MTSQPTTPTATDLARNVSGHQLLHDYYAGMVNGDLERASTAYQELIRRLDTAQGLTLSGPGQFILTLTRSQMVALSDAICRGIEHMYGEINETPQGEERKGLISDQLNMLSLRDDLQRQVKAALFGTTDDQPADRARPTEDEA